MKLYMIYTEAAVVLGCKDTQAEAIVIARREGPGAYVDRLTINDPKDALRRILGNRGGYADEMETVYICKRGSITK